MRRRGWVVTFTVVGVVLVALGFTVFGLGPDDHAVASAGGSSWLWSAQKGELARVNAETGKVDTRFKVTDAQGHSVDVEQTDGHLVMRDRTTGKVSTVDLSTLHVNATTQTTAGVGITIALHDDDVFVIDQVQGVVRQLDAATLQPIGAPLRFAPGLSGGVFDSAGNLWLAIEDQGTVASISPSATNGPKVVASYSVAEPGHDLTLSALDKGVAVVDNTAQKLTTVRSGHAAAAAVQISGTAVMPKQSSGSLLVVTISASRQVYVFDSNGQGHSFSVPAADSAAAPELAPGVSFAGGIYCADNSTGQVYVLDQTGALVKTISIPDANGPLQLEIRGSHLFINAPGSSSARVVDDKGGVTAVNKYTNGIQGGDPPLNPPKPPAPPRPRIGPPGVPVRVSAVAGDKQATVSWGAAAPNGSTIIRYVVIGDGRSHQVSPNRRTLTLTGLANGTAYMFSVYAVNAKGNGHPGHARPVTPTSEVPDAPKSVAATAERDGSVHISWPAAFGEGHKIARYVVTALSAGGSALAGQTSGVKLDVKAGALTFGTQYAFTVTAINDKGASSQPSPISNSVTPFAAPSAPRNVAATSGASPGSVVVTWSASDDNGRAITSYVVTGIAKSPTSVTKQAATTGSATGATLAGFGNGASVTIKMHAVNQAGDGPEATVTTRTFDKPAITAGSAPKPSYNSISVPFTVNDNGNAAKCTIALNGGKAGSIACTGGKVSGLWPATAYSYVVTATNNAGSVTFSGKQTTPTINVTVICDDPSYCGPNAPKKGVWVFSKPSQNSNGVTSLYKGDQRKALCWTDSNEDINAKPWGGKDDSRWIQVPVQGNNYIPFAWVTLDGGDKPSMLPKC